MQICDRSFELVADHLETLGYDGPLGLSCDDTKLHSTFRLYWDSTKEQHFLVGATDGPLLVLNPENVRDVIAKAKDRKATKVFLNINLQSNIRIHTILIPKGSTMVFDDPCAQYHSHYGLRTSDI